MDIKSIVNKWISVSNAYDVEKYLSFFWEDAVLNDPSVGRKFVGHKGIKEYFTSYFIGYKTHSELVKIEVNQNVAYIELAFTGEFPEGKINGTFELKFKEGKIAGAKADLL